ncbi:MAG: hypothetical protein ACE5OZ_12705 [Candidatus Heimdallarchaeota archaeon]
MPSAAQLMLKTISVVHLHCTTHIGHYFLRTGTGLDEVAPLGLTALFTMASEISGETASANIILTGIFGFGPEDDFGVLSCRDDNIQLFLLFEGAGTAQVPSFRDRFLRNGCLSLFEAFRQRVPWECARVGSCS